MRDEPLSAHTTFKIGGPADLFVRPADVKQVEPILEACKQEGVDIHVLGLGSDLLVADEGVRGVVIHIADNLSRVFANEKTGVVLAQAGASNEQVAKAAQRASLTGYEFASGIPGSIGGAAIMNAGAYDGQFSDVAKEVVVVTQTGDMRCILAEDARWGYRQSLMSDEGMVVLSAMLSLKRGDAVEIQERMDDLAQRRASKQPLELPSAGSTFKRPEGHFAGKLIQDAGLQGLRIGGAQVSTKHAGFVVNVGGATAADVRAVIAAVQHRVFQEFGVQLEPEVRMWGFAE